MNESSEIVVPLALVSIETFGEGEARAPKPVLLIPDGKVISANGTFYLDEKSAEQIIAKHKAQGVDVVIDFEHASCEGYEPREGIAPAAGWVTDLWYEGGKGKGLLGRVEWNERGRALVRAKEYKYLSPAVGLDPTTRRVMRLDSLALCHKPAIVGGLPVAASRKKPTDMEINAMDPAEHEKLIGELRAILLDKGVAAQKELAAETGSPCSSRGRCEDVSS